MKKLLALMLCAALFLCLAPSVSASSLLPKPGEGQVIFIEADNDENYLADFPLAAVTAALRDGDNLRLEFPAAKMTLKGYFARYGDWRRLYFSDGFSIGGADFGPDGLYTGIYTYSTEQPSAGSKESAPTVYPVTAQLSQAGINVFNEEHGAFGELRKSCLEWLSFLTQDTKPDWQLLRSMEFEFYFNEAGELSPAKAFASFNNGISVHCVNPQVVFISDSLSLEPLSEGRAILRYTNSIGDELLRLNVRCAHDESGQLQFYARCDKCEAIQTRQLHMLSCGHYTCQEGFSPEGHEISECRIAGHCALEGEHSRCKNCLEPVCTGEGHGYGLCLHEHNWVPISIYSSRCVSCGYTYNSAGAATS